MLLCINCHTLQPDGTLQCTHCRMKNQFRPVSDSSLPAAAVPGPPARPPQISCENCGANLEGDPDRCPRCRFPSRLAQPMSARSYRLGNAARSTPARSIHG